MIRIAHAASEAQISAQCFVDKINSAILFPLITLLLALAFLVFLYGMFEYVREASSDAGREKGKQHILYGTIGMFVMLSAFSILSLAAGTFNISLSNVDCSQFSDQQIQNITTSPGAGFGTFSPGDLSSPGFGAFTDEPVNVVLPSVLPTVAPDTPIEPGNLLNPDPTPGATVIDTVSPSQNFPVIDRWDNGSVLIDCGGNCYVTGVFQECTGNHQGVVTGVVSNAYDVENNYIVCSP